jgi:hypothetical protein
VCGTHPDGSDKEDGCEQRECHRTSEVGCSVSVCEIVPNSKPASAIQNTYEEYAAKPKLCRSQIP